MQSSTRFWQRSVVRRTLVIVCLTAGAWLCVGCSEKSQLEPPRLQILAPPKPAALFQAEPLPSGQLPEDATNEDGIAVCRQVVQIARSCQGKLMALETYYSRWEAAP